MASPSDSSGLPRRRSAPPVIGVVGGVASGKSTVARLLEQWGAVRLDADRVAKEALDEPHVRQALLDRFGKTILTEEGSIDRAALGRLVFDVDEAAANRAFLERLTHPIVRRKLLAQLEQLRADDELPAIVLDVPLLLEVGWNDLCDEVLFVDAPQAARRARAAARGWDERTWRQREAAQWPVERKREAADVVIDNGRDTAALEATLRAWWRKRVEAEGAGGIARG